MDGSQVSDASFSPSVYKEQEDDGKKPILSFVCDKDERSKS